MNILVLNPLGLHLGYLGCYGNDWIATPNLDRIAAEGATFDRHFVETPEAPGREGEAPAEPAACDNSPNVRMITASRLGTRLALPKSDWPDGIAWINGPNLGPPWNLPDDLLTLYTEDDEVEPCTDPDAESASEPDFLLRVQDTYAAAVTCFDAQVGRLLDEIDARKLAEKLLLIVTSGASLPLGEHGVIGWKDLGPHEELVHVPLLMRGPGVPAGTRIAAITQRADLLATLSKIVGQAASLPESSHARPHPTSLLASRKLAACATETGLDLWPLLNGEVDAVRPHAVSRTTNGEVALRTLDWALFRSATASRLYVKPDDRWEVSDVASQHRELVEALEAAAT